MTDKFKNIYLPPFSQINNGDYLPAVKAAIAEALTEVDEIVANPQPPSFENTIEALENSGQTLERVLGVFYPLLSADADDEMMQISLEISPLLSDYSTKVSLNRNLFSRIKSVYQNRHDLSLSRQQEMLLERTYSSFTRSGANLEGNDRIRYGEISKRLGQLTTTFGQNVKKELARFALELTTEQMTGLPEWLREQAAEAAGERKSSAPYVITLEAPVYTAFMKSSPHDDLRRKLYQMYNSRNTSGQFSNIEVIKEIVALRLELARLLGYETFAHYKLERTMAKTPAAVWNLLNQLRQAYAPALARELAELEQFAGEKITPWNYSYHFNRLRKARYDFDPEDMRPYFELSRVTDGVFSLASRLYGISFSERSDIEVYHPDVKAFEVKDADGSTLGYLLADFFPRQGRKSPGAWMTEFREADGSTRPIVNIVMNFTKPGADRPSLLLPSEVTTFLHEFGHALHSLLTKVEYSSIAGTNVFRDFVEFPSQFNENFFSAPEFINSFARHYQTNSPLPDALRERLRKSEQFGAAYACMRQLNFGFLDMALHSVSEPVSNLQQAEVEAINPVRIFPAEPSLMVAPSFGHIFSGGYAAGYYSYKWSEVLDADAFSLFKKDGVFSARLAEKLRREVLEKGGADDPERLYVAFAGRPASINALLERDGILPGT